MSVDIPVHFIDTHGNPTFDRVNGSPVIQIWTGYSPRAAEGETFKGMTIWALLDTGADYFYVDPDVLQLTSALPIRPAEANGDPSWVFQTHINIVGTEFSFTDQEVAALDLRASGYKAILGRSFFQYATLAFDLGDRQGPRLTYHGNRDR